MAEISENSIEKFIKPYRYGTVNNARSTSIQDNHVDCLRLMYLHSRYDIRQFDKAKKPRENEDEISNLIDSFFILNEEGNGHIQAHKINSFNSNLHFMKEKNPTNKRPFKCEYCDYFCVLKCNMNHHIA